MMKSILKLEELGMWLGALTVLYILQAEWYWYGLLILGPDISMLAYLAGNKTGAVSYNLFHHKGIAIALMSMGYLVNSDPLFMAGVVLFGHSAMDRFFGYGLKLQQGFKYTHLGEIGKQKQQAIIKQ